jgi:transcription elongation GreA/GreB family factor
MSRATIESDKEELEELKGKTIPAKMEELRAIGTGRSNERAREMAQEELYLLSLELAQIGNRLANAQVPCGRVDVAEVGSIVTFLFGDEEKTLMIVSENGNPLKERTISTDSIVGEALLGLRVGDRTEVTLKSGEKRQIKVTDICIVE